MPEIFFEDLVPGATFTSSSRPLAKEEMVAFAREFDAQPFHTDEDAAKRTTVGELIASGWQTCALSMRLMYDALIARSSSMGAPGVEEVKWLRPVRPGDTLWLAFEVLETRQSRSRPDRGFVHARVSLTNQHGEPCMTQVFWGMFARRGADVPEGQSATAPAPSEASPSEAARPAPPPAPRPIPPLEDLVLNQRRELGSYTFTPDTIIPFARTYDPQPFHVDPEAAKRSHFGALCASGWHTAAAWMRALVADRERAREAAATLGVAPAALGPSPGFRDLKWLKPVYAGDTVSFATTPVDKRASASRPGWGLVFSHNTGDNQHGERVFEFTGSVFWQRRPGA